MCRPRDENATSARKWPYRGEPLDGFVLGGSANVLLLDEPANHLDIEAREALEETLAQSPGTILFVSHDRCFIGRLAHEVLDLSMACHAP